ncbi:MAG TPA: hypothetical protein VGJ13_10385 [Pseudonocardiaceae bacterium]|jgi:hypothetical protein
MSEQDQEELSGSLEAEGVMSDDVAEPQDTEPQDTGTVTSDEMAQALDAVRASSGELAQALDAAGIKPDQLAEAHEAATRSEGHPPG